MLFSVNGKNVEIKIEKRNRKTVKISVENPERLRVYAPLWIGDSQLEEILNSKMDWISQALYKSMEIMNEDSLKYVCGKEIRYLGKPYPLLICEDDSVPNASVSSETDRIIIRINSHTPSGIRNKIIAEKFKEWYEIEAKRIFEERVAYYSWLTGFKPKKIFYKFQKTRWGSCSGKGNINLNVNLILAPMQIIDYVILHEICHLEYLDHSKAFWDLLGLYMADYKSRREWLKKNGHMLKI